MSLAKRGAKEGTQIEYMSPELLFLAQSGQPYRGSVTVRFESVGETFDLVEFKKYLTSLRSQTFNAEDIAYEIYSTIEQSIKSSALGVCVELSARGGIQQTLRYGEIFSPTKKNTIFQIN